MSLIQNESHATDKGIKTLEILFPSLFKEDLQDKQSPKESKLSLEKSKQMLSRLLLRKVKIKYKLWAEKGCCFDVGLINTVYLGVRHTVLD